MNTFTKKRILKDIYDENQDKWIQAEIMDNKYFEFKGWGRKWNIYIKNIPDKYIKNVFTHTKRFRPKVGDVIQIKTENIEEKNIYNFKKFCYGHTPNKRYYNNLIESKKNLWSNALVVKKSGKFISVLYIYFNYICIIKVKRDANVVCEKNTHNYKTKKNLFYDIFIRLLCIDNQIKNFKNIFLHDLNNRENLIDYKNLNFVLDFVVDNINYFEDIDKKISFLKLILLNTASKKIKDKCYFELAHLYIFLKKDKRIIFRYLCLSGNVNIAMKYVQNKMYLENKSNDPVEVLYDLLNIE